MPARKRAGPGMTIPTRLRVTSRWEDIRPQDEGRPKRRSCRLTEAGAQRARITTIGLRARPAGGLA